MKFRPDIQGLRALAIAPVVLFHANAALVPGSYIGVDIFFVISGYLITDILLGELRNGIFSIAGFYARRVKRLFPLYAFRPGLPSTKPTGTSMTAAALLNQLAMGWSRSEADVGGVT